MDLDRIALQDDHFVDSETGAALKGWRSLFWGSVGTVVVADHDRVIVQAGDVLHDIPTRIFLRAWAPITDA